MKTVVFYHSHCLDGTMAAAAALHAGNLSGDKPVLLPLSYKEITEEEFFATHSRAPMRKAIEGVGEAKSFKVVFVDICPKAEVLVRLAGVVPEGVLVLDHHKSAQEDLKDFVDSPIPNLEVVFDMSKSGAALSWEHFCGHKPILVQHVEDRDLWKFKLDLTRELNLWLSVTATKNDPESFLKASEAVEQFPEAIKERALTLSQMQGQVVQDQASKWRRVALEGFPNGAIVPAVAYPSEVCEYVYDHHEVDWVMGFSFTRGGDVAISLRSKNGRETSADVTKIARMFGGGGHVNASGCVMDLDVFMEIYKSSGPR